MSGVRHFVSAGWPYLYDIPGLHNCVPMLFADVCARFHRLNGDEVFFLCGADEHGARTEYVARGYGVTPQALVDEKFAATVPLLREMGLSLDAFERTSDPFHRGFVQDFLADLARRDVLVEDTIDVAWCEECQQHLPDRFLEGTCPSCGAKTYGNQCNDKKTCARIVNPKEVVDAHCAVCSGGVEWRPEPHLFFPLDRFAENIRDCVLAPEGSRDEVRERVRRTMLESARACVTRDTAWGIPAPGLPRKTVYSWVDSLLAKVSMLAKRGPDIEQRFWRDPNAHHHFFLGMDGTPFYGALFPALLTASGYPVANWRLYPNEVFIYEGGVCSKSTGTGIWLSEALATLPCDYWRFYIFLVHASVEVGAEKDADFRWDRFCEAVNSTLLTGLNAAATAPSGDATGAEQAREITDHMAEGAFGRAFRLLLRALIKEPSREKTARLAPLLGCYLPSTGEMLARGAKPFEHPPLYSREIQMAYLDRVDARAAHRDLAQKVTDARADALCVCPIDLREQ